MADTPVHYKVSPKLESERGSWIIICASIRSMYYYFNKTPFWYQSTDVKAILSYER